VVSKLLWFFFPEWMARRMIRRAIRSFAKRKGMTYQEALLVVLERANG
jgi:hypothetical protein